MCDKIVAFFSSVNICTILVPSFELGFCSAVSSMTWCSPWVVASLLLFSCWTTTWWCCCWCSSSNSTFLEITIGREEQSLRKKYLFFPRSISIWSSLFGKLSLRTSSLATPWQAATNPLILLRMSPSLTPLFCLHFRGMSDTSCAFISGGRSTLLSLLLRSGSPSLFWFMFVVVIWSMLPVPLRPRASPEPEPNWMWTPDGGIQRSSRFWGCFCWFSFGCFAFTDATPSLWQSWTALLLSCLSSSAWHTAEAVDESRWWFNIWMSFISSFRGDAVVGVTAVVAFISSSFNSPSFQMA